MWSQVTTPKGLKDLLSHLSDAWDLSHWEDAHELHHSLFRGLEVELPVWLIFVGAHLGQQFVRSDSRTRRESGGSG